MKRLFLTKRFAIVALFLILFLGFWLRYQNFTTWPRHGATFDEFAWTWLGINLIQKGEPISWSPHPHYKQREHLRYQGAAFWIVRPYLEHPPLFGLVAGGFTLLNGAKDMYDVTLAKMRPLALILGVLSILMVFVLTQELYGVQTGLLASLLYATIPTTVIGSRIVQNENFLIPFWLLSLFLITRYIKTNKKWLRNLSAIIAGLLSLAKVPWLVVAVSLSMVLAYNRKWSDAFFVGAVSMLIFSLFIVYGIYFDRELFLNLWGLQVARYDLSFINIHSIFLNPLITDRFFIDGWIYFGFFSIILLTQEFKKHAFILLPFLAYFVIFAFAIPNEPGHGWYRYPFYPFLTIATAVFIKEYFSKNYALTLFFLIIIGLSLFQLTWAVQFGFSKIVLRAIIVSFMVILLPLFFNLKGIKKAASVVSFVWFAFLIVLNIWSVYLYNEQ